MSFNFQLSIILTCGTDESLQDIINHLQISSHFWSSWDDQSYARTHYIWETDWKHAWARSLLLPLRTLLKLYHLCTRTHSLPPANIWSQKHVRSNHRICLKESRPLLLNLAFVSCVGERPWSLHRQNWQNYLGAEWGISESLLFFVPHCLSNSTMKQTPGVGETQHNISSL